MAYRPEKQFPLPGFDVIQRLDRDRHGELYKVRVLGSGQIAVVHLLTELTPPIHARFRAFLPVFEQMRAVLKDPHFVRVHDMGDVEGYSYSVSDFVSGYTVGEWCARKGKLKASDALLVAEYAAAALRILYESENMVHGNLRASDLLVSDLGEIRLRCFSTAPAIMAGCGGVYVPDYANPYLAPELERGARKPSIQSDMYMLGMLLLHLVTGERPDSAAGDQGSAATRVFRRRARLPAELRGMLRRLTAQDPDERYTDWQRVAADVMLAQEDVLTSETETRRRPVSMAPLPTAGGAGNTRESRRQPRRHGTLAGLLLAMLLGVAVGLWVVNVFRHGDGDYGALPIFPRRTNREAFRVGSERMDVALPPPSETDASNNSTAWGQQPPTSVIDNVEELIDNSNSVRR